MQNVNEVIQQVTSDQTKPSRNTSQSTAHDLATFAKAWRLLQSSRLLSKDQIIDGTDYRYWQHACRDLTNEQIMHGLERSKNFEGYFTLGEWRKLCEHKEIRAPYHRAFLPEPDNEPVSPEQAKKYISELKKTLGM